MRAASPATRFTFGKAELAHVTSKVQLWREGDDPVLPNLYYTEAVRADLPIPPEMHVVPHAGHYDFLAPCLPGMAERLPMICAHEPGFNPAAFHRDVVRFLKQALDD